MRTRPELEPPPLDIPRVERLTALVEQIVRAIDGGRPTRELIARFNEDAGTKLTQFDFHSGASTLPPRDFAERALTRVPTLADLQDDEAAGLIRRLQADEGSARDRYYWTELLARGLGQPGMADLIQYPDHQIIPEEMVQVARTCAGSALARYIDPLYRGYHVARALLRYLIGKKQLVVRAGAPLEDLARGAAQFIERGRSNPKQLAALSEWLVEQPTVEELFADDEAIEAALALV